MPRGWNNAGKAIVKSLFHLRQCVHAMSTGKRPEYRSSKLTRLLEPSLMNGSVSVICATAHVVTNARQVVDCLEFGTQAQTVRLAPKQNIAKGDSDFHKLQMLLLASEDNRNQVSDLPCGIRREGGQSLVIGGPSLVILEGRGGNPL